MNYGFTDAIEKLRIDTRTPPTWVKQVFGFSILAATYALGVTHGIQLGGHAQAAGSIQVVSGQLPTITTVTMPFSIAGSTAFNPTHQLMTLTSRVQSLTLMFSLLALATVVGWTMTNP